MKKEEKDRQNYRVADDIKADCYDFHFSIYPLPIDCQVMGRRGLQLHSVFGEPCFVG